MNILHYLLDQSSWLHTEIYRNGFFFLDLWSVVRLLTGFMLLLLLRILGVKRVFTFLFLVLFLYEVVEVTIDYLALNIFRPETFKDQITDIFTGMTGGLLSWWFLRFVSARFTGHEKEILRIIAFLAAFTYSFTWVGFYGYSYNISFFNFSGINLTALTLWTIGSFSTIMFYVSLKGRPLLFRLPVTWFCYIVILLIVEYTGYHIFGLHENSLPASHALVFGLIHGNNVLHFFYLTSPLYTIGLFTFFKWIVYRSIDAVSSLSFNNLSN